MENPAAHPVADRVSLDQVLRVAELAQLELTATEQQDMLRDLNSILGHVAQLDELDTTHVPAMAQVSEIFADNPSPEKTDRAPLESIAQGSIAQGSIPALRPDTPRPSLDRSEVMAAAPDTDGTFFKVPKVIER